MALSDDIKNILADFGDKLVTDLRENLLRKENRPTKSKLSASIKYNDTVFKNGSYVINEEILHPKRIYATQTNTTAQAFIVTGKQIGRAHV